MKSRTSFFNPTAFRKDILRYSPIWALYTIFLLLVLFGFTGYSRASMGSDVLDSLMSMGVVNLLFGGICGIFLFADLFNNRMCNALHAFPMRREGWLTTHLLSGFLFSFVPNLLAAGIGALLLWEYAYIAAIWLAISTLQFLFFFGTAALAVVCAGNVIGTIAIYGITHFITYFVYTIAGLLYQPLLYGVRLNDKAFFYFFPLDKLCCYDYAKVNYYHDLSDTESKLAFAGMEWDVVRYVGICAAVGILAMYLACLVYRRRNLENAGDFISLKPLAPIFILICTIGVGVFFYMFSDLVGNSTYLFLLFGMVIGYFAAKMLLNRTLKVFNKKSILSLLAVIVVFAGSMMLTWVDPLGITTFVPKAENIESAYISGADKSYYYYSEFGGSRKIDKGFQPTNEQEMQELLNFHKELIKYRPEEEGTYSSVQVSYVLKSGRTVIRYYEVLVDSPLGEKAGRYYSDMRYIFEVQDTSVLQDAFKSATVTLYYDGEHSNFELTNAQDIAGLLEAIAADCQIGKMAQNWAYHGKFEEFEKDYVSINEGYVDFYVTDAALSEGIFDTSRFYLQVYSDSTNTVNYLAQMAELYAQQQEQTDEPVLTK